jgi:hypothetical protein
MLAGNSTLSNSGHFCLRLPKTPLARSELAGNSHMKDCAEIQEKQAVRYADHTTPGPKLLLMVTEK